MKELVIIGAGGMGRTLFDLAKESHGYKTEFDIKGFIDDDLHALDNFFNYPPILGRIKDYMPKDNEVFSCSIGGNSRIIIIKSLKERNATFINLINNQVRIGSNVQIGTGNIIGAYVTLGADAKIQNYNMIQSYTVIGHDVIIGDYNRIDTHVTCVGGTKINNATTIFTGAVINHGVTVEDNAHVGANSFVIRSVKPGETVLGIPAKKISY